jgi:hypothetical protein
MWLRKNVTYDRIFRLDRWQFETCDFFICTTPPLGLNKKTCFSVCWGDVFSLHMSSAPSISFFDPQEFLTFSRAVFHSVAIQRWLVCMAFPDKSWAWISVSCVSAAVVCLGPFLVWSWQTCHKNAQWVVATSNLLVAWIPSIDGGFHFLLGGYPLVNVYITNWKDPPMLFMGKSNITGHLQ